MTQKFALVTGASKGIGREITRQLVDAGYFVFLAARNIHAGETEARKIHTSHCRFVRLDVTDPVSVAAAFREVSAVTNRLDVLVNNAAVLLRNDESLARDDERIFAETMQTNVYGPLRVTQHFLPLLGKGSRVVMMSSSGGLFSAGVGGWSPAYCASKTALNGITVQLAHELRAREIAVNACDPGWVRTDMGGSSAPRLPEKGAETPVWLATANEVNVSGKMFRDKKMIDW